MKINKWNALVMLWAFSLGISLSYRPPEMTPVTLGKDVRFSTATNCTWNVPKAECRDYGVKRLRIRVDGQRKELP